MERLTKKRDRQNVIPLKQNGETKWAICLCHTQTCAFPLNEIGKTVFLTREEAEATLRREQDEKGGSSE